MAAVCSFIETAVAAPHTFLVWGKSLETVGALFLAWVAWKVAWYQIKVLRPFVGTESGGTTDVGKLGDRLGKILENRRKQFGTREAVMVLLGTALVALGCLIYLGGVICEPAPPH